MNQPWPIIVSRYKETEPSLPAIRALLAVSEHICDGDLATGLHGWLSMWDLCIAQTQVTYPETGPFLKISVRSSDQLEFTYVDTQITNQQWHRIVDAADAVPHLLKFLDQMRWFPGEVLAAKTNEQDVGSTIGTIEKIESLITTAISANKKAPPDLLESLLDALLVHVGICRPRQLDGLLAFDSHYERATLEVAAIAVLIDRHLVEPVLFNLRFDAIGQVAEESTVRFGQVHAEPIAYGSRQHDKLSNALSTRQFDSFPWRTQFVRVPSSWRMQT